MSNLERIFGMGVYYLFIFNLICLLVYALGGWHIVLVALGFGLELLAVLFIYRVGVHFHWWDRINPNE